MTQAQLAIRVTLHGFKISQQGIAQIERRGNTRPKCLVELAAALELTPEWLKSGKGVKYSGREPLPKPNTKDLATTIVTGKKPNASAHRKVAVNDEGMELLKSIIIQPNMDLPVWSSVPEGRSLWLVESRQIGTVQRPSPLWYRPNGFACTVLNNDALPLYGEGDLIFVDPIRPVKAGDDCLFLKKQPTRDSLHQAMIRRVSALVDEGWEVKLFSPDRTKFVSSKDWPRPMVIVAKHNGGG